MKERIEESAEYTRILKRIK